MSHVFISYSKRDRPIAKALADDLTRLGLSVWWDFELYAGDDFHDEIEAQIDAAKAVIVIWSAAARKSRWVRSEASRAQRQKKLITTLAPGASLDDVPMGLDQLQSVPVLEREQIYRSLARLGVMPADAPEQPLRPPFKLPTSPAQFEEDIGGYLTLIAEAIPNRIADIDVISERIDSVQNGPKKQRTSHKVQALAELQTLARMPDVDAETRLNIDELVKVVYHIDTELSKPAKTFIKPQNLTRQVPAYTDLRDLVDIAALGDAIQESTARSMFEWFKDGELSKQPSEVHAHLKPAFEAMREQSKTDKNFKTALSAYLDSFERDFIHRNHEGHRISDFLTTARLGKTYLFLFHVARRRRHDFSPR